MYLVENEGHGLPLILEGYYIIDGIAVQRHTTASAAQSFPRPSDIQSFTLCPLHSFLFDLEDLSILYRLATMKSFASLLVGSVALFSFVSSALAAFGTGNATSCGAPKPDDSYFSVVGVQGTGVHSRQELRELQQDSELWNMFILAFVRFQAMSQDDKTSYYQLGGKQRPEV